jgi:hypothetical protein
MRSCTCPSWCSSCLSFNVQRPTDDLERILDTSGTAELARQRRPSETGRAQHASSWRWVRLLATVFGTLLAVGHPPLRATAGARGGFIAPAVLPDIVLAVALLTCYTFDQPDPRPAQRAAVAHCSAWRSSQRWCAPGSTTSIRRSRRQLATWATPPRGIRADHLAVARTRHRGGCSVELHAVARRVRDRVLHERPRPPPRCRR